MTIKYAEAIKTINPNASFLIKDDNLDEIQWFENTTPINKNDIISKASELQIQEDVEKQAKIDAKASALAKLTALGLTEEEVKSIL